MDLAKLEQIIQLMEKYGLQDLKYKSDKEEVELTHPRGNLVPPTLPAFRPELYANMFAQPQPYPAASMNTPLPPPAAGKPAPQTKLIEIRTPFVGTFFAASSPKVDPYVQVGQRIKKGDALCIIEAMKLMNEIEAECDGVVKEILVENEQPVEFNQTLFLIEP